jgi:pimeloyl-ACP methyl ester carboxylesterase
MSETDYTLTLRDGKTLHGRLREVPNTPLVIMAHGITGSMNEHLHFIASQVLAAAGYSVLRINFYDDADDARKLHECTPTVHAHDLDDVVRDIRATWPGRPMFLIGHSMGLVAASMMDERVEALVSWDGAHSSYFRWLEGLDAESGSDRVFLDGAMRIAISQAYVDEGLQLDSNALIARLDCPMLFLYATELERRRLAAEEYAAAAKDARAVVAIPDSDHTFSRDGNLDTVLVLTLGFLNSELGQLAADSRGNGGG